ncbi:OmpA family protein [Daejeonella oryzae]|uniref:OmpA family protein n=1 Tax=Daejeonella oryzae TaxID=1122943 RepID=UPI0004181527|nr:OmpA family protein [Daejeonella oryzae]
MIKNYLKTSALAAAILFSGNVMAQDSTSSATYLKPFSSGNSFRTWSVGFNGGVLSPVVPFGKNDFTTWKADLGYGGYIKKQIIPAFGIQANFLAGKLKADNSEPLGNGTSLNSPFASYVTKLEYSGSLSGNLSLGNIYWMHRQNVIQPYLTAGAGIMSYTTKLTTTSGEQVDYKPGDNIRELFIPVGAGMKFVLSKGVNLDLGYTMNFVDADNVDGYPNIPQNDKFSFAHIGLEFALGPKSKPQLATYNPVAAMEADYISRNASLREELAAERANNAQRMAEINAEWKKFLNDADKDGVSDHFDKCPDTPAGIQVDGAGCPLQITVNNPVKVIVTEEDKRVVAEAIRNLEFDFGKASIRSTSFESLDRVAGILVNKNFSLQLAGHTDNVGNDASNMKLSKDRAESVKSYLVSKGANPSRISATGFGEGQPIASNKTESGRQQNRRVEFTLY